MPPRLRALLVRALPILCVLVAGGVVGIVIDDDGTVRVVTQPSEIPVPAAVGVDGPDRDAKPDDSLELDREAREVYQNATATPERYDLAGDLRGRDETPVAQHTGPLATPHFPGCTTRILPTNWSNRTAAVKAAGVHYTAGLNRPGLSDMNGLTAYASSPAAGVSWHFLIDAEGHCYYSVPLGKKAWTIGNLNSETDNIEVIGTGREPVFPAAAAGQMKLSQVLVTLARLRGYPVRLGAVAGCRVTRSGIITHWMGGACAGGHVDIKPYAIETVVARARAATTSAPNTKAERAACASLRYHRRIVRGEGDWQDVIVNRRGQRVKRYEHASVRKRLLRKRHIDERRLCG